MALESVESAPPLPTWGIAVCREVALRLAQSNATRGPPLTPTPALCHVLSTSVPLVVTATPKKSVPQR